MPLPSTRNDAVGIQDDRDARAAVVGIAAQEEAIAAGDFLVAVAGIDVDVRVV